MRCDAVKIVYWFAMINENEKKNPIFTTGSIFTPSEIYVYIRIENINDFAVYFTFECDLCRVPFFGSVQNDPATSGVSMGADAQNTGVETL